jgi:hypothetical protein
MFVRKRINSKRKTGMRLHCNTQVARLSIKLRFTNQKRVGSR